MILTGREEAALKDEGAARERKRAEHAEAELARVREELRRLQGR